MKTFISIILSTMLVIHSQAMESPFQQLIRDIENNILTPQKLDILFEQDPTIDLMNQGVARNVYDAAEEAAFNHGTTAALELLLLHKLNCNVGYPIMRIPARIAEGRSEQEQRLALEIFKLLLKHGADYLVGEEFRRTYGVYSPQKSLLLKLVDGVLHQLFHQSCMDINENLTFVLFKEAITVLLQTAQKPGNQQYFSQEIAAAIEYFYDNPYTRRLPAGAPTNCKNKLYLPLIEKFEEMGGDIINLFRNYRRFLTQEYKNKKKRAHDAVVEKWSDA